MNEFITLLLEEYIDEISHTPKVDSAVCQGVTCGDCKLIEICSKIYSKGFPQHTEETIQLLKNAYPEEWI